MSGASTDRILVGVSAGAGVGGAVMSAMGRGAPRTPYCGGAWVKLPQSSAGNVKAPR